MIQRAVSCGVVVLAIGAIAAAQTANRPVADAQTQRINERIRGLQAEADALARESRTLLGQLRTLEIEREIQVERLREAQEAVSRGEAAIRDATARLETLEQRRIAQLPDVKAQLVDVYKRGRARYAALLFGGRSVRDLSRTARAVAALMRINEARLEEHRRTMEQLRTERGTLETELRGLEARAAEAQQARAAAERAVASRANLVAQIDARRDLNAQLAGELQVAYQRMQQQIANAAAGRAVDPVVVPLAPFRGALEWPAPGRLALRFGQTSGRPGDTTVRNGIEIAAPAGTAVRAVHPGTVSYADILSGFGNLVIVDHGSNAYTVYGYLASMTVAQGSAVDAGAELGRVGATPAGPAAVYFEVRIDGRSVDPVQWLRPR